MTDTAMPAHPVELRAVSKRYGAGPGQQVTAADNVSLAIEAGAFVALTGS